MRKLIAIIMAVVAFYMAALNGQGAVITVAICGSVFVVLMFVFPRYQKRKTTVELSAFHNTLYKGAETPVSFRLVNQSPFPVSKLKLTMTMAYVGENNRLKKKLYGSVGGKKEGSSTATFFLTAPYCGKLRLTMNRMRIYDYLSLFSSSKKLKGIEGELMVLPFPKDIRIGMPDMGSYTSLPAAEMSVDKKGDDLSEIRMIREYHDGDLMRHIHRNYSARTEKLWIKEYQKETDYIFELVLDLSSDVPLSQDRVDAFFEIAASMIRSLASAEAMLNVYWYDAENGGIREFLLNNRRQTDTLMTELIESCQPVSKELFRKASGVLGTGGLLLNGELEWFFLQQPVYQFHEDSFEKELENHYFELGGVR